MLFAEIRPTPQNTLVWTPQTEQEEVTLFLGGISFECPGFVQGLHPVEQGDIKQNPSHLELFFGQLREGMKKLEDLDSMDGELYLISEKARKPVTEDMVQHIQFEEGLWAEDCPRVEGRVELMGADENMDYRDMTFLFSNFGDHFETSLDELLPAGEMQFIPAELRKHKFRSVEFLIQIISKCINSLSYPARLSIPNAPEETERAYAAFEQDCAELGFPLVLLRSGDAAEERALVMRFNELLIHKACLATTDREVKQFGQRVKLDADAYFPLTRGMPMPMEGRGARPVQFGLNEKMQAAGFLIRTMLDKDFRRVFNSMVALGVLVGEAATYNRGGRLVPDLNWGGDFGYQFAPHQEYRINGEAPVCYDAMRVGYCAAATMVFQDEKDYPFEGYQQYREMMGHPASQMEAVRNLLKAVLLDPFAPRSK